VGANGEDQPSLVPFPRPYFDFFQMLFGSDKPSDISAGFPVGSCVLIRVEALHAVGLFDEQFFIFFEDTDLGRRLRDAGWEIALAQGARIVHHGHQTVSRRESGGDMDRQMLRSRYLYFRKHRGVSTATIVDIGSRLALALRAAKALVERDRAHARHLLELARYNPRVPLPVERDSL
jgi:GT2 family glycosyltransferase